MAQSVAREMEEVSFLSLSLSASCDPRCGSVVQAGAVMDLVTFSVLLRAVGKFGSHTEAHNPSNHCTFLVVLSPHRVCGLRCSRKCTV